VTLRSTLVVEGRYDGFSPASGAEYEARYAAWASSDTSGIPHIPLGAHVSLMRRHGDADQGRFVGYDFQSVRYVRDGESEPRLILLQNLLAIADRSGASASGDSLSARQRGGMIPIATRLRVRENSGLREIPLDRVLSIRAHGVPVILEATLVAGVIVGIVVLIAHQPHSKPASTGCSSYPPAGLFVLGRDSGR
jgi:hypothetical protein